MLGEVLRFHVADELFDSYRIDAGEAETPSGVWAVPSYTGRRIRFDLERPKL